MLTGPHDFAIHFQIVQISGYVMQVKFQHSDGTNKYYTAAF